MTQSTSRSILSRPRLVRRSLPTLLAAALALGGAAAKLPGNEAVAAPPPGYHLVWSDEFNQAVGTAPDSTNWTLEVHPAGFVNDELESYDTNIVHAHVIADPAATDGKALQIEATSDGNGAYSSARINSNGKENIQYGFVEARIRMPYGQGIWPASGCWERTTAPIPGPPAARWTSWRISATPRGTAPISPACTAPAETASTRST